MVSAEATGIALKLAVFAVMSAAKTRGQWKLVSNWCDLLEPAELGSQARVTKHGSIPSDRERWYFAKLKALLRKAALRTKDGLWNAIGQLLDLFPPAECANYLVNAGYPRSA